MDFSGQIVLITGASRGIGAAAAEHLASLGAQVVLTARSEGELAKLAEKIGPKALAIACDIADFKQVQAAVDQTVARFGRLDIVVNNAGMLLPVHRLADFEPADWDRVIDVNVKGVFYMMKAALPIMTAQGGGTILNISSGAAYGVLEGWSHYCASKAAVLQLTRSGHAEYGDQGIRCLGLSPGTVATQMQKDIKASGVGPVAKLNWEDHVPADWPARTLLWMCSAQADSYLGQEISLRDPVIREKVGLQ